MSIKSVMPSNQLILCRPLLLLPSILPNIKVFSSELVLCIRWPQYWSFGFSISPSNEYPMNIQDWFPLGWTGWVSLENRMANHFSILALRIPWTVWKGWATRKAQYYMIFLFFLYSFSLENSLLDEDLIPLPHNFNHSFPVSSHWGGPKVVPGFLYVIFPQSHSCASFIQNINDVTWSQCFILYHRLWNSNKNVISHKLVCILFFMALTCLMSTHSVFSYRDHAAQYCFYVFSSALGLGVLFLAFTSTKVI